MGTYRGRGWSFDTFAPPPSPPLRGIVSTQAVICPTGTLSAVYDPSTWIPAGSVTLPSLSTKITRPEESGSPWQVTLPETEPTLLPQPERARLSSTRRIKGRPHRRVRVGPIRTFPFRRALL